MTDDELELVRASKTVLKTWVDALRLDSALLISERDHIIVLGGEGRRPSPQLIAQLRTLLDELERGESPRPGEKMLGQLIDTRAPCPICADLGLGPMFRGVLDANGQCSKHAHHSAKVR